jgi:hypothetical protein
VHKKGVYSPESQRRGNYKKWKLKVVLVFSDNIIMRKYCHLCIQNMTFFKVGLSSSLGKG